MKEQEYTYYSNFSTRDDLQRYGDNALLLYSIQLKYGLEDIDEVATTSLVDGSDDKKTDLVYIDTELGEAVIAQGFMSQRDRDEASANKASDLNTAIPWLLARDLEELPDRIRSAAQDLRDRINAKEVSRIVLWYSHNLPESSNVEQELRSAEATLSSILDRHYPDAEVEIYSIEVGLETIEDWYKGLTIPILVTEEFTIENSSGFEYDTESWSSFTTAIPSNLLYEMYKEHGTNLFSANVRDYLGSRKSDSNINNGIKKSAKEEPENFFVYNNGITALVNDFKYDNENKELKISGFSVVNGAQTTGAIGSLDDAPDDELNIPIRLIKCDKTEVIGSIVKFNNSQNKINAPDFRSNDSIQRRLTNEFNELDVVDYSSRRGGATDIIRRNPNLLPSVTAGQVLAAFHGEPGIAYNQKSKIWDSDSLYSRFFNDNTTAKHIFFCYSLLKTIEDRKVDLMNSTEDLRDSQEKLLKFLRSRGAIVLLLTSISDCLEDLLDKKIDNRFSLNFCNNISLEEAKEHWNGILNIASSFAEQLNNGLQDGIKNQDRINEARENFKQLMSAVRKPNSAVLDDFADQVCT